MNEIDNTLATRPEDAIVRILEAVPADAPGVIIIDIEAVRSNWRALRDLVAPARCASVVKANAYGLGTQRVIPALVEAGCETFFLATLDEALEARALAPDCQHYILDGILPGSASAVSESGAWPVISSLEEAREWAGVAASMGADTALGCALHLDSGLNRLGFGAQDLRALAGDMHLLAKLDVKLVMSHMACADEPHHLMNPSQLNVFKQLLPLVPTVPASLAASDGLMLGADYRFDLVRPGYALYGGQAFQGARTPVSNVVSSFARVVQVRDCAPGHSVGYSAAFQVERQSRIAVVALGYADGFARLGSCDGVGPTPRVVLNGQFAPVVGRVSMDLVTVDVTDIENPGVKRGDWAEVIGPNLSLEDVATSWKTIGYEVLTRLGSRFHRTYLGASSSLKTGG